MDKYKKALEEIASKANWSSSVTASEMKDIAIDALKDTVTVTAGENCPACSGSGWCPRCRQRCGCNPEIEEGVGCPR